MTEASAAGPGWAWNNPRPAWVYLVLGLAVLSSCAPRLRRPSVEVLAVRVTSLGLAGGTVDVDLEVVNPNARQIRIRRVDYDLQVAVGAEDWESLTRGSTPEAVTLPARDTVMVTVPVPFEYEALGAALRSLLREGQLRYRLLGEVLAGSAGLEFRRSFEARGRLGP